MASNVQALRVFSDNEALAWLRSHGPANATPSELDRGADGRNEQPFVTWLLDK